MNKNFTLKVVCYGFYIFYNIYIYNLTKKIKENEECLKKNNCDLIYNSRKITLLKYLVSFFIILGIINIIIPINKYCVKIPLIGSMYSFIILVCLTFQFIIVSNILNKINDSDCYNCLQISNIRLFKLILKYKFKTILFNIFISYLILVYL
jgi:hypothetical protein